MCDDDVRDIVNVHTIVEARVVSQDCGQLEGRHVIGIINHVSSFRYYPEDEPPPGELVFFGSCTYFKLNQVLKVCIYL